MAGKIRKTTHAKGKPLSGDHQKAPATGQKDWGGGGFKGKTEKRELSGEKREARKNTRRRKNRFHDETNGRTLQTITVKEETDRRM